MRGERRGTVLVVDDDESVLFMVKRMLERLGFTVETARGGWEAVTAFGARPRDFACVLLDLAMPILDGRKTFSELKRIHGDVKVILSSGGSAQDLLNEFSGTGLAGFIQKPYSTSSLAEVLGSVLGPPGP